MNFRNTWLFKSLALVASPALIFAASATYAQDSVESETVVAVESDAAQDEVVESVDEIVVTGSRFKRSTFNSISPLQIITADMSREAGLLNAADILQTSTSASGQQIDLTFSGFVLDNGPGSRSINLRGLGADRTLVLINGRRMAPGGAEGAPYAPNVGSVPQGLVGSYEILTDGASSIYGSDAIGGVTNIILRKDLDGFDVQLGTTSPKYDGGETDTLTLTWGKVWDRGFIGMGLDYNKEHHATYASRPWTAGCETNYEVGSDGSFRTEDLFWENARGAKPTDCKYGAMTGYASVSASPAFPFGLWSGTLFYTPGNANGGYPDFSTFRGPYAGSFYNDTDGDGVADVSWGDYILNGSDAVNDAYLYPDYDTATFMAYGEYTFEGDSNLTAYFETLYSESDYSQMGQPAQFFPTVPANNPYNICNPDGVRGVDCGLAEDEFLFTNPGYSAAFLAAQGVTPDVYYGFLANGPSGPLPVRPVVAVAGDRTSSNATFENARFVGGLRGDLPGLSFGSLSNWSFDSYISYSKSVGKSHRYGIRGDRTDLALGNYSSTSTPCENDSGVELASDAAPGCVPVDMFAPSLLAIGGVGDFASQAERDYLFDSRDFDTEYEQTIISGSMSGDIAQLEAGPVMLGVGFEYRKDEINSMPDAVARDGLFFGYFSDGGAVGEKDSKEAFFEIEAPLLAGKPLAEELIVNASARLTDDELYGSNTTESLKIGWRPVNSLLIRATYGTAFRAPNLRELYLLNQTGFNSVYDPCVTPAEAFGGGVIGVDGDEYNSGLDPREAEVLANCLANGVDPTSFRNGGNEVYSVELGAGGSLTLDPETSTSWTAGFAWEQEFSNEFELGISSTYYEVEIEDTIIEPSAGYIVYDCYNDERGSSAYCSRITRGADSTLDFIDQGFVNRDNENGRGVDVNINFADQFTIMDRPIDVSLDIQANRTIERSIRDLDDEGVEDYDDFAEEWGFPAWKANSTLRFQYEKWRLQLRTNFIGSQEQDVDGIDVFSDIYDTTDVGTTSDTCLGGQVDVLCRDVGFADNYMTHSLSVSYSEDNWFVTLGASNITDKAPPLVDGSEVSSMNNAPIGYGYNLLGRTLFLNVGYDFGAN
jgi:iron complex outermembrane receptor protein